MNNSLPRLFQGMAAALAQRVLPHVGDDFARGQVYGVIYLLRCLELRTDWSDAYLQPQWAALQDTAARLRALLREVPSAPGPTEPVPAGATLHQRCEAARTGVCAAYDWCERHADELGAEALAAVRRVWQDFIEADLKHELSQRVALPYSEMSTGSASTAEAKDSA